MKESDEKELDIFNGFFEIEKETTAKMELNTKIDYNPLIQDFKVNK